MNLTIISYLLKFIMLTITPFTYCSRSTSWLVACPRIFRLFTKRKFNPSVLWQLGQKSPKLNSRLVYCLQLYGIWILTRQWLQIKSSEAIALKMHPKNLPSSSCCRITRWRCVFRWWIINWWKSITRIVIGQNHSSTIPISPSSVPSSSIGSGPCRSVKK